MKTTISFIFFLVSMFFVQAQNTQVQSVKDGNWSISSNHINIDYDGSFNSNSDDNIISIKNNELYIFFDNSYYFNEDIKEQLLGFETISFRDITEHYNVIKYVVIEGENDDIFGEVDAVKRHMYIKLFLELDSDSQHLFVWIRDVNSNRGFRMRGVVSESIDDAEL